MPDSQSLRLLRLGAFVTDLLVIALLLIIPGSLISLIVILAGGNLRIITWVWNVAWALLAVAMLFRDGWKGRSLGKSIFGLRIRTPHGDGCSWQRSFVRNVTIAVPLVNLAEIGLLFAADSRRLGDRLAKTVVTEE